MARNAFGQFEKGNNLGTTLPLEHRRNITLGLQSHLTKQGLRRCATCKVIKPLTEQYFFVNNGHSNNLSFKCRDLACGRIYRRKYPNKEGRKISRRKYYVNNRLKYKIYRIERIARQNSAEGRFTPSEWIALKMSNAYLCAMCGNREPNIILTIDHIIPLSKGGTNYISNIQPLCKSCNFHKWNNLLQYEIVP